MFNHILYTICHLGGKSSLVLHVNQFCFIYVVYFALAEIIYNRYTIYDKDMCMYNETIECFIGPGIDSHETAVTKFGEMKRNDVAPRAHGPSMQHLPSLTYISADNH